MESQHVDTIPKFPRYQSDKHLWHVQDQDQFHFMMASSLIVVISVSYLYNVCLYIVYFLLCHGYLLL